MKRCYETITQVTVITTPPFRHSPCFKLKSTPLHSCLSKKTCLSDSNTCLSDKRFLEQTHKFKRICETSAKKNLNRLLNLISSKSICVRINPSVLAKKFTVSFSWSFFFSLFTPCNLYACKFNRRKKWRVNFWHHTLHFAT